MPDKLRLNIESVKENHISGVVAPAGRISRNNNLYLPSELMHGDGKTIPFFQDHEDFEFQEGKPTGKMTQIKPRGYATLHWNPELQRLEFDGEVTDPDLIKSIREGERAYVSLAAQPHSYDIYHGHTVPLGLDFFSLSAVSNPGFPFTSLNMESWKEAHIALIEGLLYEDTLDANARAHVADKNFAYIDSNGDQHLPIHDKAHVTAAKGRFNQTDFESPSAKAKAKSKINGAAKKFGLDPIEDFKGQENLARLKQEPRTDFRGGQARRDETLFDQSSGKQKGASSTGLEPPEPQGYGSEEDRAISGKVLMPPPGLPATDGRNFDISQIGTTPATADPRTRGFGFDAPNNATVVGEPMSSDAKKMLGQMKKQYEDPKKAKSVFYATLKKAGKTDKDSLSSTEEPLDENAAAPSLSTSTAGSAKGVDIWQGPMPDDRATAKQMIDGAGADLGYSSSPSLGMVDQKPEVPIAGQRDDAEVLGIKYAYADGSREARVEYFSVKKNVEADAETR